MGIKHITVIKTAINGSFNQVAFRYGHGIANGNDGGNSKTWLTYGAPDLGTNKFSEAYSLSFVEHFLLNLSSKYSINGYALYTKCRDQKSVDRNSRKGNRGHCELHKKTVDSKCSHQHREAKKLNGANQSTVQT